MIKSQAYCLTFTFPIDNVSHHRPVSRNEWLRRVRASIFTTHESWPSEASNGVGSRDLLRDPWWDIGGRAPEAFGS